MKISIMRYITFNIIIVLLLSFWSCKNVSKDPSTRKKKIKTHSAGSETEDLDLDQEFERQNADVTKILRNKAEIIPSKKLNMYLRYSARSSSPKYLRLALERGANPNNPKSCDPTIFHDLFSYRNNSKKAPYLFKCLDILKKYENNPNWKFKLKRDNNRGNPAIFYALDANEETLQKILGYGFDIHIRDKRGYNALYYAAERGYYHIIPFLERQGLKWEVNLNSKAKKGEYANDECVIEWVRTQTSGTDLIHYKYFYLRKKEHLDRYEYKNGESLLHIVEPRQQKGFIKYLLYDLKVDPNKVDNDGRTFLHRYILDGLDFKDDNLFILDTPGIDLNIKDKAGYPFITYYTCTRTLFVGSLPILNKILKRKIDFGVLSPDGYNLLELLCTGRFRENELMRRGPALSPEHKKQLTEEELRSIEAQRSREEKFRSVEDDLDSIDVLAHFLIKSGLEYSSSRAKGILASRLKNEKGKNIEYEEHKYSLLKYLKRVEKLEASGLRKTNLKQFQKELDRIYDEEHPPPPPIHWAIPPPPMDLSCQNKTI